MQQSGTPVAPDELDLGSVSGNGCLEVTAHQVGLRAELAIHQAFDRRDDGSRNRSHEPVEAGRASERQCESVGYAVQTVAEQPDILGKTRGAIRSWADYGHQLAARVLV